MHVERFDLVDEFGDMSDAEIAAWLEHRWMKKDEKLEELRLALKDGVSWG